MFGSGQPSDEQILHKIRKGEEKILLHLFKRNYAPVCSYVKRNSGTDADAEDVLQEALIALWQNVNNGSFNLNAKLDTYLYAVAKNVWLKQLRKTSRMDLKDFQETGMDVEDENETEHFDEKHRILAQYMEQIGETCRKLLTLFYFEQWDMEHIAEKLEFANAQTAKAKKYQCKKKLEELVKKNYKLSDIL